MTDTPRFTIVVNGQPYSVDIGTLRGFDIRALSGVPASHALVVENEGAREDVILRDDETIDLNASSPLLVYSRPPTMQGIE